MLYKKMSIRFDPKIGGQFKTHNYPPKDCGAKARLDFASNRAHLQERFNIQRNTLVRSLNEEINAGKFPKEQSVVFDAWGNTVGSTKVSTELFTSTVAAGEGTTVQDIADQLSKTRGGDYLHSHPTPDPLSVDDIVNSLPLNRNVEAHIANSGYSILERPTGGWENALTSYRNSHPSIERRIEALNITNPHFPGSDFDPKALEVVSYIGAYMQHEFDAIITQITKGYQGGRFSLAKALSEQAKRFDRVIQTWASKLSANYRSQGIGDIREVHRIENTDFFQQVIRPKFDGNLEAILRASYRALGDFSEELLGQMDFQELGKVGEFNNVFQKYTNGVIGNMQLLLGSIRNVSTSSLEKQKEAIKIQMDFYTPASEFAKGRLSRVLNIIENELNHRHAKSPSSP